MPVDKFCIYNSSLLEFACKIVPFIPLNVLLDIVDPFEVKSSKVLSKSSKVYSKEDIDTKLYEYAKNFAKSILTKSTCDEIKNSKTLRSDGTLYSIEIDCKNKYLGKIGIMKVEPSKFLDCEYVDENTKLHTKAHHNFKTIFLNMLKTQIGEDHKYHVKFEKDNTDKLVFRILFYKTRMNTPWITYNPQISSDSKIRIVKQF